jgi:hypothetical protein
MYRSKGKNGCKLKADLHMIFDKINLRFFFSLACLSFEIMEARKHFNTRKQSVLRRLVMEITYRIKRFRRSFQ